MKLFQPLLLWIAIALQPVVAETITLVADEWPPYNDDPSSGQKGYGVELMERIFKEAGIDLDYQILPWSRAIQMVEQGTRDALIGATKEEVPDFVFPQEAVGLSKLAILVRSDSTFRYQGIDSLKGMQIGALKGYEYGEEIDTFLKNHSEPLVSQR